MLVYDACNHSTERLVSAFSDWLVGAIEQKGATYGKVAEYARLSTGTVHNLVKGKTRPSYENCVKLADYFGVNRDAVLHLANYEPKKPARMPEVKSTDEIMRELQASIREETRRKVQELREKRYQVQLSEEQRKTMVGKVAPVFVVAQRVSAGPGAPVFDTEYVPVPIDEELSRIYERLQGQVVSGTSMAPEINPGDTVIYDKGGRWEPGKVVVAMHDGETLVKRLAEHEGRYQLVGNNGAPAIDVDETTHILGVVVRVMTVRKV